MATSDFWITRAGVQFIAKAERFFDKATAVCEGVLEAGRKDDRTATARALELTIDVDRVIGDTLRDVSSMCLDDTEDRDFVHRKLRENLIHLLSEKL